MKLIPGFLKRKPAETKALQSLTDDRLWTRIFDWTPGAWQAHSAYDRDESPLSYPTVFACQTLIASDIAKLPLLIQREQGNIWVKDDDKLIDLLKRPNYYQNRQQFFESWIQSKLTHGNTYILKIRENGRTVRLQVLDPVKVTPLISDNGNVFYRLNEDRLRELDMEEQLTVPATEIIHDRFNCIYHPLVGLSPIFASSIPALAGLKGLKNIKAFFANSSNPGGVLSAPGSISDATATRLKEYWEKNFTGDNSGKVAVAGDGLTFVPMRMLNTDAQMLELLGWDDAKICSTYHVPPWMVNVGQLPSYNNIEALWQGYYSQCLQSLIEGIENCLDPGLEVAKGKRFQFDIEAGLFRMDTANRVKTLTDAMKGMISPDEARAKMNLPPVAGGANPYLQQQNYSLEALARRDEREMNPPEPEPHQAPDISEEEMDEALSLFDLLIKTHRRTAIEHQ